MSALPAMCTAGGECFAFPDVCKVPPAVPTPFPNSANPADGNGTDRVKIMNTNALRQGDAISKSAGDEGGALGGVISGTTTGKVEILSGSSKVRADGRSLAYLGVPTLHNSGNASGTFSTAGQDKVKVAGS